MGLAKGGSRIFFVGDKEVFRSFRLNLSVTLAFSSKVSRKNDKRVPLFVTNFVIGSSIHEDASHSFLTSYKSHET